MSRGDQADMPLDRQQIVRCHWGTTSMMYSFEDQFHQHQDKLLSDEKFSGTLKVVERRSQLPGFQWVWKTMRNVFGSDFQTFMDDIMKRTHIVTRPDLVEAWKTGIAAELSEASV
jgi:hypothetical protein